MQPSTRLPAPPARTAPRYELSLRPGPQTRLRIFDRERERVLVEWRGGVVDHLLQSGIVPRALGGCRRIACDKDFVHHLILAATATRMALDQLGTGRLDGPAREGGAESLARRLARLDLRLADPERRVARLLFAHRGRHLTAADVQCLLLLDGTVVSAHAVSACLDELARCRVVQRIEVDADNVFYDTDVRPHLHVFDARTRTLSNASACGLLHFRGGRQRAALNLDGDAVRRPVEVSFRLRPV